MHRWTRVTSGFNPMEESINFSPRAVGFGEDALYETSTLANIEPSKSDLDLADLRYSAVLYNGGIAVAIEGTLVLLTKDGNHNVEVFDREIIMMSALDHLIFLVLYPNVCAVYASGVVHKCEIIPWSENQKVVKICTSSLCRNSTVCVVISSGDIYELHVESDGAMLSDLKLSRTCFSQLQENVVCSNFHFNKHRNSLELLIVSRRILYSWIPSSKVPNKMMRLPFNDSVKKVEVSPCGRRILLLTKGGDLFSVMNHMFLVENRISSRFVNDFVFTTTDHTNSNSSDSSDETSLLVFRRDDPELGIYSLERKRFTMEVNDIGSNIVLIDRTNEEEILLLKQSTNSIRVMCLKSCDPQSRLERLVRRGKFSEATEFAEKANLSRGSVLKAEAQILITSSAFWVEQKSEEVVKRKGQRLLEIFHEIEEIEILTEISSCLLLPEIEIMKDLLQLAERRIEQSNLDEVRRTQALKPIQRSLLYVGSFMSIHGRANVVETNKWIKFSQCTAIELCENYLKESKLYAAGTIVTRHHEEITNEITAEKVLSLFNCIAPKVSVAEIIFWIRSSTPLMASTFPEALPLLDNWIVERALSEGANDITTWPKRSIELLTSHKEVVTDVLEQLHGLKYTAIEVNPSSTAVDNVLRNLRDMQKVIEKHGITISCKYYTNFTRRMESAESCTSLLLDLLKYNPYSNLKEYIVELAKLPPINESEFLLNFVKEAVLQFQPIDEFCLFCTSIIARISSLEGKLLALNFVTQKWPFPWHEEIEKQITKLATDHPLVRSILLRRSKREVESVLGKYGIDANRVDSTKMRLIVNHVFRKYGTSSKVLNEMILLWKNEEDQKWVYAYYLVAAIEKHALEQALEQVKMCAVSFKRILDKVITHVQLQLKFIQRCKYIKEFTEAEKILKDTIKADMSESGGNALIVKGSKPNATLVDVHELTTRIKRIYESEQKTQFIEQTWAMAVEFFCNSRYYLRWSYGLINIAGMQLRSKQDVTEWAVVPNVPSALLPKSPHLRALVTAFLESNPQGTRKDLLIHFKLELLHHLENNNVSCVKAMRDLALVLISAELIPPKLFDEINVCWEKHVKKTIRELFHASDETYLDHFQNLLLFFSSKNVQQICWAFMSRPPTSKEQQFNFLRCVRRFIHFRNKNTSDLSWGEREGCTKLDELYFLCKWDMRLKQERFQVECRTKEEILKALLSERASGHRYEIEKLKECCRDFKLPLEICYKKFLFACMVQWNPSIALLKNLKKNEVVNDRSRGSLEMMCRRILNDTPGGLSDSLIQTLLSDVWNQVSPYNYEVFEIILRIANLKPHIESEFVAIKSVQLRFLSTYARCGNVEKDEADEWIKSVGATLSSKTTLPELAHYRLPFKCPLKKSMLEREITLNNYELWLTAPTVVVGESFDTNEICHVALDSLTEGTREGLNHLYANDCKDVLYRKVRNCLSHMTASRLVHHHCDHLLELKLFEEEDLSELATLNLSAVTSMISMRCRQDYISAKGKAFKKLAYIQTSNILRKYGLDGFSLSSVILKPNDLIPELYAKIPFVHFQKSNLNDAVRSIADWHKVDVDIIALRILTNYVESELKEMCEWIDRDEEAARIVYMFDVISDKLKLVGYLSRVFIEERSAVMKLRALHCLISTSTPEQLQGILPLNYDYKTQKKLTELRVQLESVGLIFTEADLCDENKEQIVKKLLETSSRNKGPKCIELSIIVMLLSHAQSQNIWASIVKGLMQFSMDSMLEQLLIREDENEYFNFDTRKEAWAHLFQHSIKNDQPVGTVIRLVFECPIRKHLDLRPVTKYFIKMNRSDIAEILSIIP